MKLTRVLLPSQKDVQAFVETLVGLEGDFDFISGNYILDARSMMGIFSLDLSQPIQLKIYNDSKENLDALEKFMVEK